MALLFSELRVRASREKIISNLTAFIGSKLGLSMFRTAFIVRRTIKTVESKVAIKGINYLAAVA